MGWLRTLVVTMMAASSNVILQAAAQTAALLEGTADTFTVFIYASGKDCCLIVR